MAFNPFGRYKYVYIGIYALPFIMGMWYFRDKKNSYRLSAQQGIMLGFILTLTAALAYAPMVYLFLAHTDLGKQIIEVHLAQSLTLLASTKADILQRMGEETYQITRREIMALSPADLAIDSAIGLVITGMFHTLLFMMIFKN